MIEYHAHIAALNHIQASIGVGAPPDPTIATKLADLMAAVAGDPDAAALGACLDQIMTQAGSDGAELQLLETAADLWTRGLTLYKQFAGCREGIEQALQNPSGPGSVEAFQAAVDSLDSLRTSLRQFVSESQMLHAAVSPLPHLRPPPRQEDRQAEDWDVGNRFAARRTDAYVRGAFERAVTPRERAFAFGVLSGYAGNVAGSAYLGQVVGGPRRSHRFRDRLARNAVGAWIHAAAGTPALRDLGKRLRHRNVLGVVAFPADLRDVAVSAFQVAYRHQPLPDLDQGFRRVVRQLQLLDLFERPPLPEPPPLTLAATGDVTATLTIMSDDLNPPTVGIDLDPDMSPSSPSKADSSKSGGNLCLAILLAIVTIGIALLIYCIGKWTTGKKCVASDFFDEFQGSSEPDPTAPTGTTQQQLTAMSDPEIAGHIAQELYNYQLILWQAFDLSFAFLAATGLIYPDGLIMPSPLYQQFLKTPARAAWPHLPEANSEETYHADPASAIEQPAAAAPFPAGAPPSALFVDWRPGGHSILPIAQRLLLQILGNETDSENYDLDADRGFLHACWQVAPGTSINDAVLSVQSLPYSAE